MAFVQMHCRLCDFTSRPAAMWTHLHSEAHLEEAVNQDWLPSKQCPQCGIICNDQHQLRQHRNGAKHKARVRWLHDFPLSQTTGGSSESSSATDVQHHGHAPASQGVRPSGAAASSVLSAGVLDANDILSKLEQLLTCPISHDTMHDPVVTEDGHSYERGAIALWFTEHDISPLTGTAVGNTTVQISNRGLRAVAALYHQYMAVALQADATS